MVSLIFLFVFIPDRLLWKRKFWKFETDLRKGKREPEEKRRKKEVERGEKQEKKKPEKEKEPERDRGESH